MEVASGTGAEWGGGRSRGASMGSAKPYFTGEAEAQEGLSNLPKN